MVEALETQVAEQEQEAARAEDRHRAGRAVLEDELTGVQTQLVETRTAVTTEIETRAADATRVQGELDRLAGARLLAERERDRLSGKVEEAEAERDQSNRQLTKCQARANAAEAMVAFLQEQTTLHPSLIATEVAAAKEAAGVVLRQQLAALEATLEADRKLELDKQAGVAEALQGKLEEQTVALTQGEAVQVDLRRDIERLETSLALATGERSRLKRSLSTIHSEAGALSEQLEAISREKQEAEAAGDDVQVALEARLGCVEGEKMALELEKQSSREAFSTLERAYSDIEKKLAQSGEEWAYRASQDEQLLSLQGELSRVLEASRSTRVACTCLAKECTELEARARLSEGKAASLAAALEGETALRRACEAQLRQLQEYVSDSLPAPPTSLSPSTGPRQIPAALQRPLPSPISFRRPMSGSFQDSFASADLLAEVRAAASRVSASGSEPQTQGLRRQPVIRNEDIRAMSLEELSWRMRPCH